MGNYPVRFPIPILLFGNLSNLWNDLSNGSSQIEREHFTNWVNAHVYTSGFNMKTVRSEIGKNKPVIGALGHASYRVTKINKQYYKHFLAERNKQYNSEFVNENYKNNCCWLETLCHLGEYTNAGVNRTAGMGVMRYHPRRYLSDKDFLAKKP